jgi:hypothetical protein
VYFDALEAAVYPAGYEGDDKPQLLRASVDSLTSAAACADQ